MPCSTLSRQTGTHPGRGAKGSAGPAPPPGCRGTRGGGRGRAGRWRGTAAAGSRRAGVPGGWARARHAAAALPARRASLAAASRRAWWGGGGKARRRLGGGLTHLAGGVGHGGWCLPCFGLQPRRHRGWQAGKREASESAVEGEGVGCLVVAVDLISSLQCDEGIDKVDCRPQWAPPLLTHAPLSASNSSIEAAQLRSNPRLLFLQAIHCPRPSSSLATSQWSAAHGSCNQHH